MTDLRRERKAARKSLNERENKGRSGRGTLFGDARRSTWGTGGRGEEESSLLFPGSDLIDENSVGGGEGGEKEVHANDLDSFQRMALAGGEE